MLRVALRESECLRRFRRNAFEADQLPPALRLQECRPYRLAPGGLNRIHCPDVRAKIYARILRQTRGRCDTPRQTFSLAEGTACSGAIIQYEPRCGVRRLHRYEAGLDRCVLKMESSR